MLGLADAGHQCFPYNGAFISGRSRKKSRFLGSAGRLVLRQLLATPGVEGGFPRPGGCGRWSQRDEAAHGAGSTKPAASPSALPPSLGGLLLSSTFLQGQRPHAALAEWSQTAVLPTYRCWRHRRDHTSSCARSLWPPATALQPGTWKLMACCGWTDTN